MRPVALFIWFALSLLLSLPAYPDTGVVVKSLRPEIQKIVNETKKEYPGWTAVPDPNAKLMGYSWVRTEKPAK